MKATVNAKWLVGALVDEHRRCERKDDAVAFGRYSEHHIHHALARTLERDIDAWTVLEAWHPNYGKRQRCDVYAEFVGGGELWIEAKRGWHGTGKGWNTKAPEQLRTWFKDLERLNAIDGGAQRAFVLVHYAQERVLKGDTKIAPGIGTAGKQIGKALRTGKEYANLVPAVTPAEALALLESTMRRLTKDVCIETIRGDVQIDPGDRLVHRYLACVF